MLVPGMKLDEIRKEIELDKLAIMHKLVALADKALKHMRKTRMSYLHKSFDYVSPRKNNWLIGYTFRAADRHKANVHYAAIMYRPDGFTVFYPPPLDPRIMIYTSHFFKRYDERLELNLVDPKDKIRHYLEHGTDSPFEKLYDINPNKFSFFAAHPAGVMLGVHYVKENIVKFNTFLSNDMLKGNQVERFEKLKQRIEKYSNQDMLD